MHSSFADVLAANTTVEDFGLMGKKVAALADLAEHYTKSPSLDYTLLTMAVVKHFPWWNLQSLSYFPWKAQGLHNAWSNKMPWSNMGIVVCVGDDQAWDAAFMIANLRNVVKSKLPIQIAYLGDDDLSTHAQQFLERTGKDVSFIDLTKVFDNSLVGLSSWAIKPFGLLASKYPRTILMDADVIYFTSPEKELSRYPGLSDTGALFFHDRSFDAPFATHDRVKWVTEEIKQAGRQPSMHLNRSSLFFRGYSTEEQDSASVFVDMSRPSLYLAVLFAAWMNTKTVRDPVTWKKFYGDKETFWLAAELAGVPYTFEPWAAAQFGSIGRNPSSPDEVDPSSSVVIRSTHMVHANANGDEPFWANCGIWWNKYRPEIGFGGFANWTYWYLGSRIDEVLEVFDPVWTGENNSSRDGAKPELSSEEKKQQILATQAYWGNDKNNPQNYEQDWKELSFKTRRVIESSLIEASIIYHRYQQEVESYVDRKLQ